MKIVIVGNGGSGKSTLAEKMSKDLSIPVYHLDNYTWTSNFERIPFEEFNRTLVDIMKKEDWIIDGWSYHETLYDRLITANVIIYLEYPFEFCLESAVQRNRKLKDGKSLHDPFQSDRREKESMLVEAIERVNNQYEPELRKWLDELSVYAERLIFRPKSRKELEKKYAEIIRIIKLKLPE